MRVKIDTSVLSLSRWNDYAFRFFFGGCITVIAGLAATKFGPAIGGVFLAFPAIFPAGATLIEKNEREKKQKEGLKGETRGRQAASIDAAGASIGTLGLFIFALLVWRLLPQHGTYISTLAATASWFGISVLFWLIRKHSYQRRKARLGDKAILGRWR